MIKSVIMLNIKASELEFSFIRSPKPGGQNVNKGATAVLLRFNFRDSTSFSEVQHARLMKFLASKITLDGDLVIKASRYLTQLQNKADALERLLALLEKAAIIPK